MGRCGLLTLTLVLILPGCAHLDTGQVDYRIAEPASALVDRKGPELKQGRCPDAIGDDCDPVAPARVVRRYMPPPGAGWSAFAATEVFSIELEQGLVGKNILEGLVLGRQLGNTAEIAVLANVFEFAGADTKGAVRRFLEPNEVAGTPDDPSDVEMKLIYFSDDVKRRQSFSFSNIPVMARGVYKGGSIGIQLVVMEVDAEAGPVSSLLKTLAKFGQQALPGPDEAKDLLFDLGESLMGGSKDDKLLDYRFVLSAAGDDPKAMQATFAPGRYVIRRKQERTDDMEWSKLRLDHNTGRLFEHDPVTGALIEKRDDLYLVLNVRRYPRTTLAEADMTRDWSSVRKAIQASADAEAVPLDKVTEDVALLLSRERSHGWQGGLAKRWARARVSLDVLAGRHFDDAKAPDPAPCGRTAADLERGRDLAEREASDSVSAFLVLYREALKAMKKDDAGGMTAHEFEEADRNGLVSEVATYFMPWARTGAPTASFANASAFEAAFVADGSTGDLAATSVAAARSAAPASPTCTTLTAR